MALLAAMRVRALERVGGLEVVLGDREGRLYRHRFSVRRLETG